MVNPLDVGEAAVGKHLVRETTRMELRRGRGNADCAERKVSHLFQNCFENFLLYNRNRLESRTFKSYVLFLLALCRFDFPS